MTPQERQAFDEKMAARQAVLAKWNDGSVQFTDSDAKFMTADEITRAINAGRFDGVGPDKRLRRG